MMAIVEFVVFVLAPGLLLATLHAPPKRKQRSDTSLCDSASVGDLRRLKKLLADGVDPNSADEDGTTALMAAAFAGQTDAVRELLEAGADPNARDVSGMTALMNCVMGNGELELGEAHPIFREILQLLLDYGADTLLEDEDDLTALDHAESYDLGDLAELLEG